MPGSGISYALSARVIFLTFALLRGIKISATDQICTELVRNPFLPTPNFFRLTDPRPQFQER